MESRCNGWSGRGRSAQGAGGACGSAQSRRAPETRGRVREKASARREKRKPGTEKKKGGGRAHRGAREGVGGYTVHGGGSVVHEPAHHVGVTENRRQPSRRPVRRPVGRTGAQPVRIGTGGPDARLVNTVREPERVGDEGRAGEDGDGPRQGQLQRRQRVQPRVRVAAHGLVVVAGYHQHAQVCPRLHLAEHRVELPRAQDGARVPKIAQADHPRLRPARLRRHRPQQLQAVRERVLPHVQVGEDDPAGGQPRHLGRREHAHPSGACRRSCRHEAPCAFAAT